MAFKKDAQDVIARAADFYSSNIKGAALIQVTNIAEINTPPVKLNAWKFPQDLYKYLDNSIDRLVYYWSKRQTLEDDLIPALFPRFGMAEHSAFVGGEVDFSEETSWHHPVIKDWSDLENLELREDNIWLRMITDGLRYLKERSKDRFVVKLRGASAPMELANALRGNDLFTDFYDHPEQIHRLMEFCTKASKWTLTHQKNIVGELCNGIITAWDVWLPGDSIGHLSEDTTALCSPEVYREFGLPYTCKLIEGYDHVLMHTHSLGQHVLPDIAAIPKIDFIQIANDPNCQRAIEVYKALADPLKNKVVILELTEEEIKENFEFLTERKTIIRYSAKTLKDAVAIVDLVRAGV